MVWFEDEVDKREGVRETNRIEKPNSCSSRFFRQEERSGRGLPAMAHERGRQRGCQGTSHTQRCYRTVAENGLTISLNVKLSEK